MPKPWSWLILGFGLGWTTVALADDPAARVREVLADKCLACHSPEAKKGGLI